MLGASHSTLASTSPPRGELPLELVAEVLLFLVSPSWPQHCGSLARGFRCLHCLVCYQLGRPSEEAMLVCTACYLCCRRLDGRARAEHEHHGEGRVTYCLMDPAPGGALGAFCYSSAIDRSFCSECMQGALVPSSPSFCIGESHGAETSSDEDGEWPPGGALA